MKTVLIGISMLATLALTDAEAQTLRDAVEGAWGLNPEIRTLEARRQEVLARRTAARAFFPAPPAITLSHVTDQLIEDKRQRATEIELSTPLWLPGEGTATEQVTEAELVRSDAQLALAKLTIAGIVREAAYRLALARSEAALAERRAENARALEADTARRVRAGEVAALELDLARTELFAAQANAREQQAQVAAARNSLLSLSGLSAPPVAIEEPLAVDRDVSVHPRLQAAERSMDVARSALRLVAIATRDSPEIGVVAGRNRDMFGNEYDTTVGVRFRFPFATEARNAPRRAAAQAEFAAAQAEYAAAEREIRLELTNAQQALAAAEAQVPLVESRLTAAQASAVRFERSYRAGEIGLLEVLRSRVALFEAELARVTGRLAVAQARARVNQALGIVP